jgi:hypothetical protein
MQYALDTAKDRSSLQLACSSVDEQYQESKVLRDMRKRLTCYCDEAATARAALDDARCECDALHSRMDAANKAHASEQARTTLELQDLRGRCQIRIKQAESAEERAEVAEQAKTFAEEQLVATKAAAAESEEAQAREISELAAEVCTRKEENVALMKDCSAQADRIRQLEDLKTDLEAKVRLSFPCESIFA